MNRSGISVLKDSGLDPVVADLLESLANRVQSGETIDPEQLARDHPEHAEQLRRLLPAVQMLAALDRSAQSGSYPPNVGEFDVGELGDFRIVREVGRGGMGVVYEAEQISLNRRVALKVLPFAATMDPRQLQRFQNEARAAACLHHPNIVPVHGVGCERGVHYYAMQLIEGQTLAEVIGALQSPGLASGAMVRHPSGVSSPDGDGFVAPGEALRTRGTETKPAAMLSTRRDRAHYRRIAELIAQAADALEYAHSMGVVHRDIKPGNLMLDNGGHLWVTDFGLAKSLSPDVHGGAITMTGDIVGTLRYMSPEQALAKHGLVDHRTDVYSLGATLYELLTLRPAVEGDDKQEILKRIAFEEPTPLRKLDKSIPPELETITLKSLSKEPGERYASAAELADDLRRWLGDRAITAKPPGVRERVGKWGRRHKAILWSAASVVAVAVVALGISSYLLWKKERQVSSLLESESRERQLAQTNLALASDAIRQTLLRLGALHLQENASAQVLQDALQYYEKLLQHQGTDIGLRANAADSYDVLATCRWNLGQRVAALEGYRRAIELLRLVVAEAPENPKYRHELAGKLNNLGVVLLEFGQTTEAESAAREAADRQGKLVAEFPKERLYRDYLVRIEGNLAKVLNAGGKLTEARQSLERAFDAANQLCREYPAQQSYRQLQAVTRNVEAGYFIQTGLRDDAVRAYEQAIGEYEKLVAGNGRNSDYQDGLAYTTSSLAHLLHDLGRFGDAEAKYRLAVNQYEKLSIEFAETPRYRQWLADACNHLGVVLEACNRLDDAEKQYRRAIEILSKLSREIRAHPSIVSEAGGAKHNLAMLLLKRNDIGAARKLVEVAIKHQGFSLRTEPDNAQYRQFLVNHYCLLAELQIRQNDHRLAVESCRKAIELLPENDKALGQLARMLANSPEVAIRNPREAIRLANRACEVAPKAAWHQNTLGLALIRASRWNEAIAAIQKSIRLAGTDDSSDQFVLAMAHSQLGQRDQARVAYNRAIELMRKSEPGTDESRRLLAEASKLLAIENEVKK